MQITLSKIGTKYSAYKFNYARTLQEIVLGTIYRAYELCTVPVATILLGTIYHAYKF